MIVNVQDPSFRAFHLAAVLVASRFQRISINGFVRSLLARAVAVSVGVRLYNGILIDRLGERKALLRSHSRIIE
jgi:hypothetical protein